jgi:Na+-transporting methylmalonyl-CoA/oxaloacetate decarboxylase gamma subunit
VNVTITLETPEITVQPTGVTANTSYEENTTVSLQPPPLLLFNKTDIRDFTSTVYGTATPGSLNTTITLLRWDWGDNGTLEYHEFPYSHNYHSPGNYTLTVTSFQSDGQEVTNTTDITITWSPLPVLPNGTLNVSVPTQPPGPDIMGGAPTLTLLEPVIDRMNVTLNGNLNTGSRGTTIESVTVDWNDGNITEFQDLPVTYRYAEPGIFTINITGKQSDGQTTSKRITLDLRSANPGLPGPAVSEPPEGLPIMFIVVIILITAVSVALAGVVTQRYLPRKRDESAHPDIPEELAHQETIYYEAQEKGDVATAAASAHECARMFRTLAKTSPDRSLTYHEMAEKWETTARNAERAGAPEYPPRKNGGIPETMPSREELERICSGTDVSPEVLGAVIRVAMEIAREGREGKSVGTSFIVGDTGTVLNHSRQFVLNPFHGHQETERQITDNGLHGNIKEFAQLDGAFIVTGTGVVEAAGRYITVDMSQVHIPGGFGSRHSSTAGITGVTKSIGIVVSQSGGMITLFRDGKILHTISS